MASNSETSNDGSNGGDPTSDDLMFEMSEDGGDSSEELHKNPSEEDVENLAPIPPPRQIPELLIARTLALVPRCHYPKLSLISRAFLRVISSPGLYRRRSVLGLTEPVLYALIGFPYSYERFSSWHILNLNISESLREVPSLPPMYPGSSVVTFGYNMYVIGGLTGLNQPVSTVFVLDCRFHTWDHLPSMHRARYRAAAGVIDRKIYVIGGCEKRHDDWIEVFDVDNGVWSTVPDPSHYNSNMPGGGFVTSVVMQNRIYILDALRALVYEPRQGTWQSWELGSSQLMGFWRNPSCVIEDLLYSFDVLCVLKHPIVVFDPVEMVWNPVKGLDGLPALRYSVCQMANVGGKLMVLGTSNTTYNDTWCIEITLERREGGGIWGTVDSKDIVLISGTSPSIDLSCSVTV
ncbi:PREDICTED: putative F-box/kelch-repeat protein At2g29780 [Camelina sativa]|uniref:F-box/kelch-repeat protein At2g29780 n=1 Tax=Camelina sativa TaxID=90675 RepID=A0ABM0WEJ0_CAMSA|nr:PREDICTED: putative F-box/kelch-repeat protein At2g29780 [Camelina sativa]XP_019093566.1 PREDICTED: putative F-box/kelch-repeat protein At2g29780 [Camelina sativa]